MTQLSVSVPSVIQDQVSYSTIYGNHNARGVRTSYGIDLRLPELGLYKTIKSSDLHVLQCKVEETLVGWAQKYDRHLAIEKRDRRAADVEDLNAEAKELMAKLQGLLAHTLKVNDAVNWAGLKRKDTFRIKPQDLLGDVPPWLRFSQVGEAVEFEPREAPPEPSLDHFKAEYGLLTKLFRGQMIQQDFEKKVASWKEKVTETVEENKKRKDHFTLAKAAWQNKKQVFEEEKRLDNEAIEDVRRRYEQVEPKAVEDYCDLVLTHSSYPDCIPRNWTLEYRPDTKLVVLALDMPAPESLPTVESYRYVKAQNNVAEKPLTEAARKKLYDSVLYQICLRTLHELFEADTIGAIEAIGFNGVVTSRNRATGIEETKIILSVLADKAKFMAIDLANVDPKATFRHLKGVAAAELHGLTPIPPVVQLDKTDKRFIEGRSVDVDTSTNLAAMHWEDFEHLIRELFERELATSGGEVKVTQASSDGGVDAVAFDPDPIRGGKIVIQAKRYTNTVGVAAVRDLYGTVMNEGATKGILVTTSDYGKDSYEFAKDKPLTLLSGSNLLSLLEKHGRAAHINISEAKKILSV